VLLRHLLSDIQLGLKMLVRGWRFYAPIWLIVTLGVGAMTAMFSISDGLLWRPLPYPDADRLVTVSQTDAEARGDLSGKNVEDSRLATGTIEALSIVSIQLCSLTAETGVPKGVLASRVSGNFFEMLQLRPLLGRLLVPDDSRPGAASVTVISSELWQREFGSDSHIIGRKLTLTGGTRTVVGVAPWGFTLGYPTQPDTTELWFPVPDEPPGATRGGFALARIRPGASASAAQAELASVWASSRNGQENVPIVQPLRQALVGTEERSAWVRFAAAALIFLVVCGNVSNLLLVRLESRRPELCMRAAIGASSGRLVQQSLIEVLLVFLMAAPLSGVVAPWLFDGLRAVSLPPRTLLDALISVDVRAWLFCSALALASGLFCGLTPALVASRVNLFGALRKGAVGTSARRGRLGLRGALVTAQVAGAFALLTCAGLALTRMSQLLAAPLGFDWKGIVDARLLPAPTEQASEQQRREQLEQVMQRIRNTPGVRAIAANQAVPLTGGQVSSYPVEVVDRAGAPILRAVRNEITPEYFATLGIPLLQGRRFETSDTAGSEPVVIISRVLAERLFADADPLGHWLRQPKMDTQVARRIVGVAGDIRRGILDSAVPETYTPLAQSGFWGPVIVARAEQPEQLLRALPGIVASVDPTLGAWTNSMDSRVRDSVGEWLRTTRLLNIIALIALGLAAFGLYAIVAHATALRTAELAVRSALGSPPAEVVWVAMRGGLLWLALGGALGATVAMGLGQVLASYMPGADGFNLSVHSLVALALGGAGALAAYLPARRVARAWPMQALRYE
jgi:predicted permease